MHRFFYPGFIGFYPGIGIIGNLFLIAGILGLARLFIRTRRKELPKEEHEGHKEEPSALQVLTERFAHGLITIDEFEASVQALETHNPDALK